VNDYGALVELHLQGKTEVLGEKYYKNTLGKTYRAVNIRSLGYKN
jgi:hypothetical protein